MKRALLLTLAALTFLFCVPMGQAQASVSVGLSINTGGRHGGFSLNLQSRPDMVFIPSSRVSYARNYDQDLYCYGDNWYYVDDGGWYTSRFYDGPYVQVAFASVPYYVRSVPVSYRRHWSRTSPSYSNGTQRDRSWVSQNRGNDDSWTNRNRNRDDRDQNQNRNQGRGRGNKGGNGNHRGWNRG